MENRNFEENSLICLYKEFQVAKDLDAKEGYRVVINDDKHGCQSVYHLHLLVVGIFELSRNDGDDLSSRDASWVGLLANSPEVG